MKNICIGFFNLILNIFNILKTNKELYNNRYKICSKCVFLENKFKICKICGCFVQAKTKVFKEKCPKHYW